jgi:hypothetical protein
MEKSEMEQVLKEFKKYYDTSQYDSAYELLMQNQNSFDPGVWHYNIAIVSLKNNKPVKARIHLEKAKKSGLYSNELNEALRDTTEKLQVRSIESASDWADNFNLAISQTPYDVFLTVALIFFIILIIMVKKLKGVAKWLMIIPVIVPLFFYYFYVRHFNTLITYQNEIVYNGPSQMFDQVQLLPRGTKFITSKRYEQWYFIIYPSSHQGWVMPKKVEQL